MPGLNLLAASVALSMLGAPPPAKEVAAVHTPGWPINGVSPSDEFGFAIANIGDINNDGYADIAVGAPYEDTNNTVYGSVRIYSGKTGVVLRKLDGQTPGAYLGWAVAAAGDVNGDDIPDLIVGAPDYGSATGKAFVYSGADGSILRTLVGQGAGDQFGSSVAGIGDINNDGHDDLLVGAPYHNHTPFLDGEDTGGAYVFSGIDGAMLRYTYGSHATQYYGNAVSGAGDVNNDGVPDYIVGAYEDDTTDTWSGSAHVYSGADGSPIYHLYGNGAGKHFGCDVSGLGDINGDGHADFIVGAHNESIAATGSGSARVYSGATGAVMYTFSGDLFNEWLGWSVASAGDADGDGIPDIIVGAPHMNLNGVQVGGARVYSGADGSVINTFRSDKLNDFFGWDVTGVGDINGDGFGDFVIAGRLTDYNGLNSGSIRIVLSSTYAAPPASCPGDANEDTVVDFDDITSVIANWGLVCP